MAWTISERLLLTLRNLRHKTLLNLEHFLCLASVWLASSSCAVGTLQELSPANIRFTPNTFVAMSAAKWLQEDLSP